MTKAKNISSIKNEYLMRAACSSLLNSNVNIDVRLTSDMILFVMFLHTYNIVDSFNKNFLTYNNKRCRGITLFEYLTQHHPCGYIGGAFIWTSTNEGGPFWEKMDVKWRKFIKKWKIIA